MKARLAAEVEASMLDAGAARTAWHIHTDVCIPCSAAIAEINAKPAVNRNLRESHRALRNRACDEGFVFLVAGWTAIGVCR